MALSAGNVWGEGFLDDFDRPDGEVGNGWEIFIGRSGHDDLGGNVEVKIVDNEVLIAGQQSGDWWKSGISRFVEDQTRFSFDFKADDRFNFHIFLTDAENPKCDVCFFAQPGYPFSYMWDFDDTWTAWTQIPGSEMIAGEYNNLVVEQGDTEFILTLNGRVVGTVTNDYITRIGKVSIAADAAAGVVGSLHIDNVMIGTVVVIPEKAKGPRPADGAIHKDTWVTLSWTPGKLAASHDVYLGESFDDVNDATRDTDVYRGNQVADFYIAGFPGFAYPDGLVLGTTYYWRIDEVNDADPNSPWKGDVWSFTVPPKTAFNPDPADGAEIADTTVTLSWTPGFGARLHTVYFGDNDDEVNNATVGVPTKEAFYDPGELEREKVYYWRVDEFDGLDTYKGEVWIFTTLSAVGHP
ncbi:MAG: hypothetical protein JXM79_09045 [Sedimentisphaerales bacterium]|nr:hypothetical protein [Sedimentisphaerales bacterium]